MNASITITNKVSLNNNLFAMVNRAQTTSVAKFNSVMENHPALVASLFDEQFFTSKLAPMISAAKRKNVRLSNKNVITAWAIQFSNSEQARQSLQKEYEPVVNEIMSILI